jgi:hypothetical protein
MLAGHEKGTPLLKNKGEASGVKERSLTKIKVRMLRPYD